MLRFLTPIIRQVVLKWSRTSIVMFVAWTGARVQVCCMYTCTYSERVCKPSCKVCCLCCLLLTLWGSADSGNTSGLKQMALCHQITAQSDRAHARRATLLGQDNVLNFVRDQDALDVLHRTAV